MDKMSRACWKERFWAWLIDVLLVGILWSSLMSNFVYKPVSVQSA